ncbi:hypothetical protein SCP_1302070 [Sparassis crispa]|uniref:YDG domain-containing protein n=1 Tax=Sparassis crispa TaxID=139825 RepID=A0A401H1X4_9APHY|nr:hypothetical protein SCP_1302070 [Sparassis crispa]GBE88392.1 hypothetical protein SCP_1302070 [Sparassis crispa]
MPKYQPPRHKRTHDPCVFGHIPDVPVGTAFRSRQECNDFSVHAGILQGIHGRKDEGAFSIVMSGGYEDDEDTGYSFTYTGCGGRDLGAENKAREGPQAYDQSFENNPKNMSLKVSSMTRKPVRVVRGFQLHSDFAPAEGYRYDGLYVVEAAWREMGKAGHLVCKYRFRRLDGQPTIPRKEGTLHLNLPKRRVTASAREALPVFKDERPVIEKKTLTERKPLPFQRKLIIIGPSTVERLGQPLGAKPSTIKRRLITTKPSSIGQKPLMVKKSPNATAGSSKSNTSAAGSSKGNPSGIGDCSPSTSAPDFAPPAWRSLKFKKLPRPEDEPPLHDRSSVVPHRPEAGDIKPLMRLGYSSEAATPGTNLLLVPREIPRSHRGNAQLGDPTRQGASSVVEGKRPSGVIEPVVVQRPQETSLGSSSAVPDDDAMEVDDPADFPSIDATELMWPEES